MVFKIPDYKRLFSMRTLRIALVCIGVIIVFFNDSLGKIEGFVEFLVLYFVSVCVALFHWLFVNVRLILTLKKEKAKTELMHLQSQVNPHFFFNMLNNLYGLVDRDSEKAKKLILKLSDMMRYSIYEGQKTQVPLKEEIDFISNYLELHKMRYHKDIAIRFDTEVENENLLIAPLLFIILVENAFKHGVEKLRNHASVHLVLYAKKGEVSLMIENNFEEAEKRENGIGLQNLKRRLELAYPKKHQLTTSTLGKTYRAELKIQL